MELQYQSQIDNLLTSIACEMYANTPECQKTKEGLLTMANSTYESIDRYIQSATDKGVSVDNALMCILLFFQLKAN
mgnify:CR=1 FL=1